MRRVIKFIGFSLTIFTIFAGFFIISEKFRFNAIVIHHSASSVDNYQSIAEFHRKEKGWRDAAYHLILSNGNTEIPLGFLEATGRYRYLSPSAATKNMYYNWRALHICVVGDYDKHEMPAALKAALADVVQQLQAKYWLAGDKILFHRDCSSSSCPGRLLTKEKLQGWLASETSRCPISLRMQHEKVIGGAWNLIPLAGRAVAGFSGRAFGLLRSLLLPGVLPSEPLA
ncbi:MAG: peptidoglycan recognition family protein [Desulfobaccales bacterium]